MKWVRSDVPKSDLRPRWVNVSRGFGGKHGGCFVRLVELEVIEKGKRVVKRVVKKGFAPLRAQRLAKAAQSRMAGFNLY